MIRRLSACLTLLALGCSSELDLGDSRADAAVNVDGAPDDARVDGDSGVTPGVDSGVEDSIDGGVLRDAGEVSGFDSGTPTSDAGTPMNRDRDGGIGDGGGPRFDAGGSPVDGGCPDGEVFCRGVCTAPVLPQVGSRTPTRGTRVDGWFEEIDIAVDPCTGNIGLAYTRQVASSANWEIEVVVVPADASAPATTPVRVTTAPGKADSVAVVWAGDRFGVFWSDPRHDPAPESCRYCLKELYYAAFDTTTGAIVTPEERLTTHASMFRAGGTRAEWSPAAREIGVVWTDSEGSRQVEAAIVAPDGTMRAEQIVSAAISPLRGISPRIVWNDGAWQILYSHDDPNGSRPDYLHTRRLDVDGTLGADLDLRVAAEQSGLTARGASGYATITTGGSPLALRLWDLRWRATTTLPITLSSFDGTRPMAHDGTNLYATDGDLTFSIVRLNAVGTETGRMTLTGDRLMSAALEPRMHRVGTRLVVGWLWSTGGSTPTVRHQIAVVDTSAAM